MEIKKIIRYCKKLKEIRKHGFIRDTPTGHYIDSGSFLRSEFFRKKLAKYKLGVGMTAIKNERSL